MTSLKITSSCSLEVHEDAAQNTVGTTWKLNIHANNAMTLTNTPLDMVIPLTSTQDKAWPSSSPQNTLSSSPQNIEYQSNIRTTYTDHKIYGKHGKIHSSLDNDHDGGAVRVMHRYKTSRNAFVHGPTLQSSFDEDGTAVFVTHRHAGHNNNYYEGVERTLCRRMYNKMVGICGIEEGSSELDTDVSIHTL
jgi:hypothetical protein